jgi:Ca2+/Na+ antiporter
MDSQSLTDGVQSVAESILAGTPDGTVLCENGTVLCEPNYLFGGLWFLVIALMFFAQHHTCDAYFVPAINVFVDKMRESKNPWLQRWGELSVAGATICALGCNGPELFSNLISLYTHSDAGIGVVVGSEIFNLLVIVGCSTLAAPKTPLALERLPFTRDCIAYAISIGLLYWALLDKKVEFYESCILLAAAVGYVTVVYFTKDLEPLFGIVARKLSFQGEADTKYSGSSITPTNEVEGSFYKEAHNACPAGIPVKVQEIRHGSMVDGRTHQQEETFVDVTTNDATLKLISPNEGFHLVSAQDVTLLGPSIPYKGLTSMTLTGANTIECIFATGALHGLVMKEVTLVMECETGTDRNKLLEELQKKTVREIPVISGYNATVFGGIEHFRHLLHNPDISIFIKVVYGIPELLIDSCLRLTLFKVDIKDRDKENRWPLCFAGAMFWLAAFSYCMLECANQIHFNIRAIPVSFLGITVCAVGTSFPNAVASVILSSENKPAAAIANALGSNIQNVFLAMAMPWVIYQCQATNFADIPQEVAGISEGVAWMVLTLLLLVLFVLIPPICALTKFWGWLLNLMYVVYLIDIGGETFGLWSPFLK